MTDLFDKMLWVYRAIFTQTNVGGGIIKILITARERTVFLSGMFGPNDWAADRTIWGQLIDENGTRIADLLFPSPLDNEEVPAWSANAVATLIQKQTMDFNQLIVLGKGEYMLFEISTPIQNEAITMSIRALVDTSKPSITTTGSGGTVTTTVTYDKVI